MDADHARLIANLVGSAPDLVVYRFRVAPEFECLFMSDGSRSLYGYEPEAFYADPGLVLKITYPEDVPLLGDFTPATLDADESIALRHYHRDGRLMWARQRFEFEENGDETIANGIGYDITALREAIDRLERAETIAGVGHWIFDADTERITWSDEMCRLFGFTQHDAPRTMPELVSHIHPDDRERLNDAGDQFEDEIRILHPDGTRWHHVRWQTHRAADNDVVNVVGTSFDVTDKRAADEATRAALDQERRALEEATRLSALQTAVLTSVSHEVRTPLTALLGFSELLEMREEELSRDRRRDLVKLIGQHARRLDDLLADLLDVERLRGGMSPRKRPLDVGALVRETLYRSGINDLDRPVTTSIEAVTAAADPGWTERAIGAVLGNIIKHTPPRTPVWLTVRRADRDVVIEVEDAGPGIASDTRASMLLPFSQGPTTPAHSPGVGMGLPLAQQLITQQGGDFEISDRDGGGTRVTITLPAEPG